MIFDVKQAIIDRLHATKRENIEAVINYMEKHTIGSKIIYFRVAA